MALVSVVMAVKNASNTVERAIYSILNQSYSNFELLIADDYSDDTTSELVEALAKTDSRISVHKTTTPGLVYALNNLLDKATGTYIARMDADDEALPERFALQLSTFKTNPNLDVVSGLVIHKPTQPQQEGYAYHVHRINQIRSPKQHVLQRFEDAPLANPAAMFKKELILKYGNYKLFDGPEDYEFWLRLLHKNCNFYKPQNPVLLWYDYSTRLTRTHKNYSIQAFSKLKAYYFSKWYVETKNNKTIWIWGYGKEVFKKSAWLETYNLEIAGYIDVKTRPNSTRTVRLYKTITPKNKVVLCYVSKRDAQIKIRTWLKKNNFIEGENFYFMV